MKRSFISTLTASLFAFTVIFAMTGLSVLLGDSEIIFPEAAALCAGALIAPKQAWSVSKPRFVLIMTLCAAAGLCLSLSPLHLLIKIAFGFIFAQLCIILFKCELMPAISACILPVLVNTESIVYPISVFAIALSVVIFRMILEKLGFREKPNFKKSKFSLPRLMYLAFAFACIMLYSIYPALSGNILFIAPPLMVMFCEMTSFELKFKGNEFTVCALVVLCAVIGSTAVYLSEVFKISIVLICAVVTLAVILLMNITKLYFPPAAALAFLPFIVNSELLGAYPYYVGITAVIISLAAFLLGKAVKK